MERMVDFMSNEFKNADFLDDKEKMRDFTYLTKEEFLSSYSYLTEILCKEIG